MAKKTVAVVEPQAVKPQAVKPQAVKKEVPAAEWKFVPIARKYAGAVCIRYDRGHGERTLAMVHQVADGATLCGLSTQEPSRGMSHYHLNWKAVDKAIVCRRCKAKMDE